MVCNAIFSCQGFLPELLLKADSRDGLTRTFTGDGRHHTKWSPSPWSEYAIDRLSTALIWDLGHFQQSGIREKKAARAHHARDIGLRDALASILIATSFSFSLIAPSYQVFSTCTDSALLHALNLKERAPQHFAKEPSFTRSPALLPKLAAF